jgi:hypothetical protein
MPIKEYICTRWPNYSISGKVQFVEGRFATDNPALQSLVESNDMWEVCVWDVSGESHGKKAEPEAEAGADSEALRGQVDDQEGRIGLPPLQQVAAESSIRTSAEVCGGSDGEGREESPAFQAFGELEELVVGSSILADKAPARPRKGSK